MKFRITVEDLKNANKMLDILFLQMSRMDDNGLKEHKDMATGIFTSGLIVAELLDNNKVELVNGECICELTNEEEDDESNEM